MYKNIYLIPCLIILISLPAHVKAQNTDSIKSQIKLIHRKSFKVAMAPVILVVSGLSILSAEKHTALSKHTIQEEFHEEISPINTSIDDQLRYVPVALVYGLNLFGTKGKNKFVERSLILAKSMLLQHLLVSSMKNGFNMERPNGGDNSFPSSHTAKAFVAASFLHHEFGDRSIWYSVAGYSFAFATGSLRMINNHHWLPDVLIGAGIGILSTNLIYLTHKHKFTRWMKLKNKKNLTILPSFNGSGAGIYVSLKF